MEKKLTMCEKMYKNIFAPSGSKKIRVKETVIINNILLPVGDLGHGRAIAIFLLPPFQNFFSGKTDAVNCRAQKNKGKLNIRPEETELYKTRIKTFIKKNPN